MVKKFAYATKKGFLPTDPEKENQDAFFFHPNMCKEPAFHMFGVADGHGTYGHEVSNYIKVVLP